MNTTGKIVAGIVVLIIIVAGAFYWYAHSRSGTPSFTASSTSMTATSSMPGMASSTGNAAGTSGNVMTSGSASTATLPAGSNDSDASLQQDNAAIQAQMSGLDTDNSNTSAAMNAQ